MLSISKRGSSGDTEKYLIETDSDYYMEGEVNKDIDNAGTGYSKLGLDSEFSEETFSKMLKGEFGDQTTGRNMGNGEINHVAGWDLTFSAPKSVSILGIEGGDHDIIKAHKDAVKATLDYIEKNHIVYRKYDNGEKSLAQSDNAFISTFLHTTSRELDPQLHSHCFFQNATVDDEGRVRSLESKPLFQGKMLSGKIYRSELAYNLTQLGHDLDFTDTDKLFFELSGVPKSVLEAKSKRSQQIKEAVEKFDIKSQAQREVAAIMTRQRKRNMSAQELKDTWSKENEVLGFDPEKVVKEHHVKQQELAERERPSTPHIETDEHNVTASENNSNSAAPDKERLNATSRTREKSPTQPSKSNTGFANEINSLAHSAAIDSARLAYRSLAVNDAQFKREALTGVILSLASGQFTSSHAEAAISYLEKVGELITRGDGLYTTAEAVQTETKIILGMNERHGDYVPLADNETVTQAINAYNAESKFPVNEGQRDAVESVFLSQSAISGIDGWAGTGKTTSNRLIKSIAEKQGIEVFGISPTGSAADKLFQETGINSKTLASFLFLHENNPKSAANQLWLLDESSLGNSDELLKLITLSNKLDSRLVLLGDKKQHHSVEWGRAFSQLQDAGMPTATMRDIFRQENRQYRDAVIDAANGDIKSAFDRIGHKITTNSIFDAIEKMSQSDFDRTLFVIPANDDRVNVSGSIRERMMELGTLEDTREIDQNPQAIILTSARMNRVTQSDARFYKPGVTVQFQTDELGFAKGSLWNVKESTDIDRKNNKLTLTDDRNPKNTATLDLNALSNTAESRYALSVYKQEERDIAIGDRMVWRKSDKQLGLLNGNKGTVTAIDRENNQYSVQFVTDDGKAVEHTFKHDVPEHIEWDYASTSFISQGLQKEKVVGLFESSRKNLVNQQSFYVMLSRGQLDVNIFTDDKEALLNRIENNTGENSQAITDKEAINEIVNDAQAMKSMRSDWSQDITEIMKAMRGNASHSVYELMDSLPPEASNTLGELLSAVKDVTHSVNVLTDKVGIFSKDQIIDHTLRYGFAQYNVKTLFAAIDHLQTTKTLSVLEHTNHRQAYYTSGAQIAKEGGLAKLVRDGEGRRNYIASKGYVSAFIDTTNRKALDNGQGYYVNHKAEQALMNILSGKNEINILEGSEQSIDSLVSGELKKIAQTKQVSIRSLAISKNNLEHNQALGFEKNNNVFGFIKNTQTRILSGERVNLNKEIWYVSHASAIATETMKELVELSRATGARLLLANQETESPFQGARTIDLLKSQGVNHVNLDLDRDSSSDTTQQHSNKLLEADKFNEAMDILHDHFVEHSGANKEAQAERVGIIAHSYLALSPHERHDTSVVIQDTVSRKQFNDLVREGLKQTKTIGNEEVSLTAQKSVFLTPAEKQDARYYTPGHNIIFNGEKKTDTGQLLPPGQYRILERDKKNNLLSLQGADGQTHQWSPANSTFSRTQSHEVVKHDKLNVSIGDKLRLGEGIYQDKKILARNGELGTVSHINNAEVHLSLSNGSTLRIDTQKPIKIDHGYATHQFGVKNTQANRILALLDSAKPFSVTKENLSNILKNSKKELTIVVDSKKAVIDKIKKQPTPPKSALLAKQIKAAKTAKGYVSTYGFALSPTTKAIEKLTSIAQSASAKIQTVRQQQHQQTLQRQKQNEKSR